VSGETRRAGGENRSYGADRTDGRRVADGSSEGARGVPPLPGRRIVVVLDRWLSPPANFC
jgi:hypothetical protein